MKNRLTLLSCTVFFLTLSGCETTQQNLSSLDEEKTDDNRIEVEPVYVPDVHYCTKMPLVTNLTQSYNNRVYLEEGKPCTIRGRY
jgi:hypothetical protein